MGRITGRSNHNAWSYVQRFTPLKWFRNLTTNAQLIVLLAGLNVYDFLTTKFLIDVVGFGVEANPILRSLMYQTNSVWIIFAVKTTVLAAIWSYHLRLQYQDARFLTPNILFWILLFLNFLYVLVGINNTYFCWDVIQQLEIFNVQPL